MLINITLPFFYELDKGLESVVSIGKDKDPLLFVKGNEEFKLSGYIGPKEYVKLKAINPELTDVVEYGFLYVYFKTTLYTSHHSFMGSLVTGVGQLLL